MKYNAIYAMEYFILGQMQNPLAIPQLIDVLNNNSEGYYFSSYSLNIYPGLWLWWSYQE